jgi:hypothetical protein
VGTIIVEILILRDLWSHFPMPTAFFLVLVIVLAVVAENLRQKFNHWTSPSRLPRALAVLLLFACTQPAAAYTCTISPKGDAVIVKTDNAGAEPVTCTVSCRFAVAGGTQTVTCTQQIPGGARNWYVCLRSTGGKAFGKLVEGSENCVKP